MLDGDDECRIDLENKAITCYKLSSDYGNELAQYNLALIYSSSSRYLMLKKNPEEAFKYCKLSADNGWSAAQCMLSNMYMDGTGCEQDCDESFRYTSLSADQGYPMALTYMGTNFQCGTQVKMDIQEAYRYFKLAADKGERVAQFKVGRAYKTGEDEQTKDLDKAKHYLKLSSEQGIFEATNLLLQIFEEEARTKAMEDPGTVKVLELYFK